MYIATVEITGYDWNDTYVLGISEQPSVLQRRCEEDARSHKHAPSGVPYTLTWEAHEDRWWRASFSWKENAAGPTTHTYDIWIVEVLTE